MISTISKTVIIVDLGLSKSLDTNSGSLEDGMVVYSDSQYLKNISLYKWNKAFDINNIGVYSEKFQKSSINGIPLDYIDIYRKSWFDNPAEHFQ
ncbi:16202_t:CDS:2 [Cetraspora pellucida]|uniref:16202_t:CDS:1 n=1 Tax=Cetraspora pellucida TaxID=1433469 RepID=A0A9N9I4Y1_9GLOM|nr:16202_t:CDS:2 [Cetraspora pellucida]